MNIYLPIEIKVRELEARTLLALAAAERGHSVVVGAREETRKLAANGILTPGILHDKCLTPPKGERVAELRTIAALGHKITAQDEEFGLILPSFDEFGDVRFSDEVIDVSSKIMCFGRIDIEYLSKTYERYLNKFIITGSPRVDIWRKDFPSQGISRSRELGIEGKNYILISSNFGHIIGRKSFWEAAKSYRSISADPEYEFKFYDYTSWQCKIISEFVRMIRSLSERHPQIQIVLRPHPAEALEAWPALIGPLPNVRVIREGTIIDWIKSCRVLIHYGCTSGLEAAVAGAPRVAYRALRSPYEATLANDVSYPADSLDELHDIVGRILSGEQFELPPENEARMTEIFSERLSNLSGRFAFEKIIDEWEKMDAPSLNKANSWGRIAAMYALKWPRWKLQRIKRKYYSTRDQAYVDNKFPDLPTNEIEETVNKLKKSLGRFQGVKWKRLGPKSFVVLPSGIKAPN